MQQLRCMHPRLPENVLLLLQENVPVDLQRSEKEESGVSQICSFKELYDKLPGKLSKNMSKNLSVSIAFVCILHLANEKVSFVLLGVPLKADDHYSCFLKWPIRVGFSRKGYLFSRAKRCILWLWKSRENVLVCDSFVFNTVVKRDTNFQARYVKDTICQ